MVPYNKVYVPCGSARASAFFPLSWDTSASTISIYLLRELATVGYDNGLFDTSGACALLFHLLYNIRAIDDFSEHNVFPV